MAMLVPVLLLLGLVFLVLVLVLLLLLLVLVTLVLLLVLAMLLLLLYLLFDCCDYLFYLGLNDRLHCLWSYTGHHLRHGLHCRRQDLSC